MNWNLIQGAIVEFDGVVLDTARLHETAWRLTLSGVLTERAEVNIREDTLAFVSALRKRGKKAALVSSSENARALAEKHGLLSLFDVLLLGQMPGLLGKPSPDLFLGGKSTLPRPFSVGPMRIK